MTREEQINQEALRQGDRAEKEMLLGQGYQMTHNEKQFFMKGFGMGIYFADHHVWHKTSEEVPNPKGTIYENEGYRQIPCLVAGELAANTPSGILIRFWNCEEQIWDGEDADDYDCDKEGYKYWAYADQLLDLTPDDEA